MKNLKVWLLVLPLITIACSDDYTAEPNESSYKSKSTKKSLVVISPANASNPYDSAGILHNEILDILDETASSSQSVEQITALIDSVSAAHPELMLSDNSSLSSSVSEINWLISSNSSLSTILAESSLSPPARISFLAFLSSLILAATSSYEDIHMIIVSYEAIVTGNGILSTADKQIILTSTSVARYSVSRKKRKDEDWDTSVTNIMAASMGAQQNSVLGSKMAATVGIYQNNQPVN